jgi:branched-chain amino acid transport system ATP-binding protein
LAPSEASTCPAASCEIEPLLSVVGIEAGYGKKRVLQDIDFAIGRGEAVALLGHNGAGKTTLLQAIFGLQPIWKGRISYAGRLLSERHSARHAVTLGMAMIPAEHFVFPDLSVMENLRLGARGLSSTEAKRRFAATYDDFPILRERPDQPAGLMSGGEQRMVSLAAALLRKPALLLLDEPSLGLSPTIAEQVMKRVRELVKQGVSVLLVEQNIPAALSVASRVLVLRSGQIILSELVQAFAARGRENWWNLF